MTASFVKSVGKSGKMPKMPKVVYVLLRQYDGNHTYIHGVFCGPFSAMRWAEEGHTIKKWRRMIYFREWEGEENSNSTWVIQRKEVLEY